MNELSAAHCPWCNAPRAAGTTCPRCGADYAKAAQIRAHGRAPVTAASVPVDAVRANETATETPFEEAEAYVDDERREFRLCAAAIPLALLAAFAVHAAAGGASILRIFLTMPVHEMGHAVTAWLCGYFAVPTLWKTMVPESRNLLVPLILCVIGVAIAYKAAIAHNRVLTAAAAGLLALVVLGTFVINERTADTLVTFGGDGMGMVIATALMASFYFGKQTQLYQGGLRWGFLAMGAGAFADIFSVWWKARSDYSDIPFGAMEGVGLSDSTRLVEWFGWSIETLVARYSALGACCLLVLVLVYGWGLWQAARRVPD